ncbi:DUF2975 domain-containing protein [Clostridiaceae bacterium]|nr:DUF2975 domain-containing protein [Clostridiaceae bacterium]
MKIFYKLTEESFAKPAARFMEFICYFILGFYVLGIIASFMGYQTFHLHTSNGTFEYTIYTLKNTNSHPSCMTVQMGDNIHVWANENAPINLTIQIGLSLLYAVHTLPGIAAFWFLSRVFSNIQKGQIFTERNSSYLLYYGFLQFLSAVFIPFIKLLICWLTSLFAHSRISISTGRYTFHMLISSLAFIVAAYIIHYGVHLQDPTDHTE